MQFRPKLAFLASAVVIAGAAIWQLSNFASMSFAARHPSIEVSDRIDLEDADFGQETSTPLKLMNKGLMPLKIFNIRSTCSCAGLEITNQDRKAERLLEAIVEPGETIVPNVRLVVRGRAGEPMINVISFETNDPARPHVAISIVVPRVRAGFVTRPSVVLFESLKLNDKRHQSIEVFDTASSPRALGKIVASPVGQFEISVAPSLQFQNSQHHGLGKLVGVFTISVEGLTSGPINGFVDIFAAQSNTESTRVEIRGNVTNGVEVYPSEMTFPKRSAHGEVYSGRLLCQAAAGKDVRWKLKSAPANCQVKLQPSRENSHTAWVDIDVTEMARSNSQLSTHQIHIEAEIDGRVTEVLVPILIGATS